MSRECVGYKTVVIDDPTLEPSDLFAALDKAVMVYMDDGWSLHGDMGVIDGIATQTVVKYIMM